MDKLNEIMVKALNAEVEKEPEKFEYLHPVYGALPYRAMNRAEKREFVMGQKIRVNKGDNYLTIGEMYANSEKFIYNCFGLAPYAQKAKQEGKIIRYYDILDLLFESNELIEMMSLIYDASGLAQAPKEINEDVEEVKKP